jgi:hypothetical protein
MAQMVGRLDGYERRQLTTLAGAHSLVRLMKDGAGTLVLGKAKCGP